MSAAPIRKEANPPCPRCGGRSNKHGFFRDNRQYLCKGECKRYFYEKSTRTPNLPCPRCGGASYKYGVIRGRQRYKCRKCNRAFTPNIEAARRAEALRMGDGLLEIIEQATSELAPDLREDVAQELARAVLSGEVDLSQIASAVPIYRKKIQRLSANKFQFVSLNQIIPGTNSLIIGETIAG